MIGAIIEMFAAAQAVHVANAEEAVIAHFRALCGGRRRSELADRVFTALVEAVAGGTVT